MFDALITLLFYTTIFSSLLCIAGYIADHTTLLNNLYEGDEE